MPSRDRAIVVFVGAAATALVAGAGFLLYRRLATVPDLAGRVDPARVYDDPALVIVEPGLLGTAVELKATDAVESCMAARGFDYRGPAAVGDLDALLDGYGVAAGPIPDVVLGAGGADRSDRDGYAAALYGAPLASADTAAGGCRDAGLAALTEAVATLRSLPYPIEQLEADLIADARYADALRQWSACMAGRGYTAASPEDLVASFVSRLERAAPDEGRALAAEERAAAAADLDCRATTIDPALDEMAPSYGARFVERNRPQLETLIPPPAAGGGALPPGLGTGDVQVTLQWDSEADLDLAVTDPEGASISFSAKQSASGGTLDRDANFPCATAVPDPVENVFWPDDGAPRGDYLATVTYRTTCATPASQSFVLTIRLDGRVAERIEGTLAPGGTRDVPFSFGS